MSQCTFILLSSGSGLCNPQTLARVQGCRDNKVLFEVKLYMDYKLSFNLLTGPETPQSLSLMTLFWTRGGHLTMARRDTTTTSQAQDATILAPTGAQEMLMSVPLYGSN